MTSLSIGIKRKTDQDSKYEKKKRKKSFDNSRYACPLSERQQLQLALQMSQDDASAASPVAKRTPSGSSKKDKAKRRNNKGETLLHLATIKGDISEIERLLNEGANVNEQDYAGWTPLHEACNHGLLQAAKCLLKHEANPNPKGLNDDYPLHDAVRNNHYEIVRCLMDYNANPELINTDGKSPLDLDMDKKMRSLLNDRSSCSDMMSKTLDSSKKTSKTKSSPKYKKKKSAQEEPTTTEKCLKQRKEKISRKLFKNSKPRNSGIIASTYQQQLDKSHVKDFPPSLPFLLQFSTGKGSFALPEENARLKNTCRADKENNNNNNNEKCISDVTLVDVTDPSCDDGCPLPSLTSEHSSVVHHQDFTTKPSSPEDLICSSDEILDVNVTNLHVNRKEKVTSKRRGHNHTASGDTIKRDANKLRVSSTSSSSSSSPYSSPQSSPGLIVMPSSDSSDTDVYEYGDSGKEVSVRLNDKRFSNLNTEQIIPQQPSELIHNSNISKSCMFKRVKGVKGVQDQGVTITTTYHPVIKSAIDRPPMTASSASTVSKSKLWFDNESSVKKEKLKKHHSPYQNNNHYPYHANNPRQASSVDQRRHLHKRRLSKNNETLPTDASKMNNGISSLSTKQIHLENLLSPVSLITDGNAPCTPEKDSSVSDPHKPLCKRLVKCNSTKKSNCLSSKGEVKVKSNKDISCKLNATAPRYDVLTNATSPKTPSFRPKHMSEMEDVMNSRNSQHSSKNKEKLDKSTSDSVASKTSKSFSRGNFNKETKKGFIVKSTLSTTADTKKCLIKDDSRFADELIRVNKLDSNSKRRDLLKKRRIHKRVWSQTVEGDPKFVNLTPTGIKPTRSVSVGAVCPKKKTELLTEGGSVKEHSRSITSTTTPKDESVHSVENTSYIEHEFSSTYPAFKSSPNSSTKNLITKKVSIESFLLDAPKDPISIIPEPLSNDEVDKNSKNSKNHPLEGDLSLELKNNVNSEKPGVFILNEFADPCCENATAASLKLQQHHDIFLDETSTTVTAGSSCNGLLNDELDVLSETENDKPDLSKLNKMMGLYNEVDSTNPTTTSNEVNITPCSEMDQKQAKMNKEKKEYQILLTEYLHKNHSASHIVRKKPAELPIYYPLAKLRSYSKFPLKRLNPYTDRMEIEQVVNEKRMRISPTYCRAPDNYWKYLTLTGSYHIHGVKASDLSFDVLLPPLGLAPQMQDLYKMHENERRLMRIRHTCARERLILSCEQNIMRVHARAARAATCDKIPPYSVCAYLLDEQVYHNPAMNSLSGSATALNGDSNENSVSNAFKNRNRFTVRIFNSWIRDVHDDHLKTKETLLSQQRHQAISLYALQRSEWVLKLRDIESTKKSELSSVATATAAVSAIDKRALLPDDSCVPIVNVGDDFDLLP